MFNLSNRIIHQSIELNLLYKTAYMIFLDDSKIELKKVKIFFFDIV